MTTTSIAIFGDIHGNLLALDAVLNDIAEQGIEQMICLGDISATGPHPQETLQKVQSLGCPVVMGNADGFFLDPQPFGDENTRMFFDIDLWCAEHLSDDDLRWIGRLESTYETTLENSDTLLCYHGSPQSYNHAITTATPDETLADYLDGTTAQVYAGGHTHQPFLRRLPNRLVVNPGSVGLPYEISPDGANRNPPWAEYAILHHDANSLNVEFRRVPIDPQAMIDALLSSGMPYADVLAKGWRSFDE